MENYKYYKMKLEDIIPQQHYLSKTKLDIVNNYFKSTDDYGDIFVMEYKNKVFSVDGHHRLFYLYKQGVIEVNVVCEVIDNSNYLYQQLAKESLLLNINSIKDLENRIIDSLDEYNKQWISKCESIMKKEKEVL